MKKLLTLILLFLSVNMYAQDNVPSNFSSNIQKTIQIPSTVVYTNWQLSNQGCYGCASFYWKINRTYIPEYKSYQYDIWFLSNSFYQNGTLASTYVWGIIVNVDGLNLRNEPAWLLFKDTSYSNQVTSFTTSNSSAKIILSWQGLKIY